MDGQPQIDLDKLSLADRKELNQFLQNETQKSTIQQSKRNTYSEKKKKPQLENIPTKNC